MAWNPGIPNEANLVRTASGDLIKMKENFDLLSGVATKGISGIIGVSPTPAPTSGQFLRYSGTMPNGLWRPSGLVLDEIDDVSAPAPTSGQALTFSAGVWIAATPVQTISGLTDVQMNPPTPLSGQALVYSGTHPTGKWTPSGIQISRLDDIGDVNAPSPTSGNVLAWNGSAWVNSGLSSPGNRAALTITGTLTITGGDPFKLIFDEVAFHTSTPALSGNTTSGEIVVGSGITHVNVAALCGFQLSGAAQGDWFAAEIRRNGVALSGIAGYGLQASGVARQSAGLHSTVYVEAPAVPVSSGDVISLWVQKAGSIADQTMTGRRNWLYAEDAAIRGAGGGGASSVLHNGLITMASGTTQVIPNSTNTIVTGMTYGTRVAGGVFVLSGASGMVVIPASNSIITHVEAVGCVTFSGASTIVGRRQMFIRAISGEVDTFWSPRSIVTNQPVSGLNNHRIQVVGPLMPIAAGVEYKFALVVFHNQGANLEVLADTSTDPTSNTSLYVRGHSLT